jgi:hypothetical protein
MTRPCRATGSYSSHDFPDFAQEFLRRNPDYRAQVRRFGIVAKDRSADTAQLERAHAWGLNFPVRPRRRSPERSRLLAQ